VPTFQTKPKPPTELPEHQITPNPKLEKRTRRQFSTLYKLRIWAEADACQHGELGELLRREKLYSSQLILPSIGDHSGLEGLRAGHPDRTMPTLPVVVQLDVLEY